MGAIHCKSCGQVNEFDQPHAYHAGFANQGFLYNDAGALTLVCDADGDGFIDATIWNPTATGEVRGSDCDDSQKLVNPMQQEVAE